MTLIKTCPNCLQNFRDISLVFCRDDGSELSGPFDLSGKTGETEIETVSLKRPANPQTQRLRIAEPRKVDKGNLDRVIADAVRKHRSLAFHVNSGNEHCVEIMGRENRGSLWIRPRPRLNNYRLQTTGQAQQLDRFIEDLCGRPAGMVKATYNYWFVDASNVEKIISRFASLS